MQLLARRSNPLLPIVGLAWVIKAIVLWQLHDHLLLQPSGVLDDAVYVSLGQRVAAGDWAVGPEVYYVSPFYIYFVGILLKLSGGSLLAVRFVQSVLGSASVGLMYATARLWFGPRVAIAAAALAALTGLFAFYEILLLQTAVDPFLTALALYLLARVFQGEGISRGWAAAAGCALGLLAMNRPNALAFLPVAVLAPIVLRRSREGVAGAATLALAAMLTLAPVTLRNGLIAGDWVLISSHGGLNFYIGNNEHADGTYSLVEGITPSIQGQVEDSRRLAERAVGRPLEASEVSDYFYGRARGWMAEHRAEAAFLFARKLAYVFNAADMALNYSYTYYSRDEPTLLRVLFVGPWLLVPLGIFGMVIAWSRSARRAPIGLWMAFVPVYAVAVALFFVSTRYRLPLLVPLCVTGAAGLTWILGPIRSRRLRPVALPLAALFGLGIFANWDVGPDTGRANERTEMVAHLIAAGRTEEAERLIGRTESIHPRPGFLYFRAGRGYLEQGDLHRALEYLQKARAADPGRPEVELFLGRALLAAGRSGDALPHLVAALDAGMASAPVGYDVARALAEQGRRDEAVRALRQAAAAAEGAAATDWLAFGELALRLQDPPFAEALLQRAVAGLPQRPDACESLGVALLLQEKTQPAIAALARAVALDPLRATARYNLAVALAQEGRLGEARAQAEAALRIRPDYPQARDMLERLPR